MAEMARQTEEDALTGEGSPAQPTQVRVWAWSDETITSLVYRWPDEDRRLRRFLTENGFELEYRAGTEHYPLATIHSHSQDAAKTAFPQQYLVVMHFASHYELILVEDLPALLKALRYLDLVINR
jgi:hypothetical protein